MFWKGTTPWGGFAGLLSGTLTGLVLYGLELMGIIVYGALWPATSGVPGGPGSCA